MDSFIVLIDPSLKDNYDNVSDNLGDCIIFDSVFFLLKEVFDGEEIVRISPHTDFTKKEKEIINRAGFVFVGGTNILTSNVRHFPRLTPKKTKGFYLYPGFKNLILLGTGWNAYDKTPDWATIFFYQSVLHKQLHHSLRDRYSEKQLNKAFIKNTVFTGCPSTWHLDIAFKNRFDPDAPILFTLTDYNPHPPADTQLISQILELSSKEIYFFPQGTRDIEYLHSLPVYKENKMRFIVLNHDYAEFRNLINSCKVNYIGTRLHAGIKCLDHKLPAFIVGIDNRAIEMEKDINLPVVSRNSISLVRKWAEGTHRFDTVQLPSANIVRWKEQFTKF